MQGLAAVGGAAALGLGGLTGSTAADHDGSYDPSNRLDEASYLRGEAASRFVDHYQGDLHAPSNDDESQAYPGSSETYYPFSYTKGLSTEITSYHRDDLIAAAKENGGDWNDLDSSSQRKLVSPDSGHEFVSEGMDPWVGTMPAAPAHDSDRMAFEMLDSYWMALHRDTPIANYADQDYSPMADDLSAMGDPGWYRPSWEYSGLDHPWLDPFTGAGDGPYVSQFLLHDVQMGAVPSDPQIRYFSETDYGTDADSWSAIVGGDRGGAEPGPQTAPEAEDSSLDPEAGGTRYISTGRDLAAYVRGDALYQAYYRAALCLLEWGVPFDSALPYANHENALPYISFGAAGILDLLARVSRNALHAAWYQKWHVHRRLRPEAYAERTTRFENHTYVDPVADHFEGSNAFDRLQTEYGYTDDESFLPLAYPEGSPAHPSYPSGHSTVGGACITVLKVLFSEYPAFLNDYVQGYAPTADGSRTEYYDFLTLAGELNKLLMNVGLGRCWAGVHYRSDHLYGALLGEQVAVATLLDHFQHNSHTFRHDQGSDEDDIDIENLEFDTLSGGTRNLTHDTLDTLRTEALNNPFA